jgi:hypothetical protein
MNEARRPASTYLGGKVWKQTLAWVEPPTPPNAPTLKRLLLPQGELAQFYDGADGIRCLACIELRAGTVRGNHYHKVKAEYVYVIRGRVELIVEEVVSTGRVAILLETGDLAFIETGVAHALRVIEPGHAIEFSPAPFDPVDIHRVTLV